MNDVFQKTMTIYFFYFKFLSSFENLTKNIKFETG